MFSVKHSQVSGGSATVSNPVRISGGCPGIKVCLSLGIPHRCVVLQTVVIRS